MVYWHNPKGETQIIALAEAKAIASENKCYLRVNYAYIFEKYQSGKTATDEQTCGEQAAEANDPIWVYWEQGEANMPEMVRICYHSLLENSNEHPVHLLTQDNFRDFVNLPDIILEKKAQGLISPAHFSDILRAELLFQYGGMWIDATVLVTRPIQSPDLELFSIKKQTDYEYVSQFRWTGFLFYCKKGNLLFAFLRTFLREYWQKENSLIDYLLLDYGIDMAYDYLPEVKKMLDAIPYNNEHVLDLKEMCLSYKDFDQTSFLRLTETTQFHKFTNHLKYDTAKLSTYQYLKKKYMGHLLPPSGADRVQKSETEQLEDCLKEIASVLETQAKQIETPGLAHGKTGVAIFFFHYADYTQVSKYEDIACELIEAVILQLSTYYTLDFEDGLTGIGAGIEYLVRQKFVDADTDEDFASLDSAFSNLIFGNFVSGKHILAIGKYFLARYHHPETGKKAFLEQNLHRIIELLDRYTKINSLYRLQILTLLKELSSCCIHPRLPELIERLTGSQTDSTEASLSSLQFRQIKSALFSLSRSDIASRYGLSEGYAGLGLSLLSRLDARHASWYNLLSPDSYRPKHSVRILMACSPILNNPYVLTLAKGIESETFSVTVDKEPFWNPEENVYDIMHIHWPEALFREWLIPQEAGRAVLKETLQQWKQKGTKIVYTRHDEITHYTRQAEESKKLFDVIESEADALIHLGNYSREKFMKEKAIAGQKHFVIPHHVYDQLYGEQGVAGIVTPDLIRGLNDGRTAARALLNIPMDKFVVLAFGSFRDSEEKQLIRNAFNALDLPNKFLVAPSWNHVNPYDESSEAGLSEENAFLGDWIVEDEMVAAYFAAADVVFLQRIRTFNSGNLPLGFFFNKTVVGPAIGNMTEYLNKVDNFSFDPTNPASVVSALESACRRAQFPQTNGQYAKEHWCTDRIAEIHRSVYLELLENPTLPSLYEEGSGVRFLDINKKIAFLIVYTGSWPWYFPYFLHSCRYNPTIDFYIFTDIEEELPHLPPNVRLIPYSLGQFRTDASKALGFEVAVESGYKLCDFKPAYGCIFSDWLKEYDFWGYCDIDLVFGNIRAFMTDALLEEYDVVSARHDYLTGCFALYRNNPAMRELFKQSKDYQKVFTDTRNFFFDETNFAFKAFEKGLHYSLIKTEVESMTHVVRRLQEEGKLKAYFEFQIVEGFAGNMLWDRGTLIYRKEFEAMLYHFVRFKRKYSEEIDLQRQIPDRFRIGKKKIY